MFNIFTNNEGNTKNSLCLRQLMMRNGKQNKLEGALRSFKT